jgi:glycosyltransferase involved in cell wall biosynthesis
LTHFDLTVVIPLYNEDESLPELVAWIDRVVAEHKLKTEVLLIDDGSTDNSWDVVCQLSQKFELVKGIKFQRNYGKSGALNQGFKYALGDVVITMDADLQDSPDEIPALVSKIRDENFDVISGWKKKRYDPISKTIPTKLFNWVTRKFSGIYLHDFNCGLKAYKKEVIKAVEVYGEMHRYIPVLAKNEGFHKIGEMVVQHRSRKYGISKFGLERFMNGFLDLLTLSFTSKFGKKPMHFFGAFGVLMFLIGLSTAGYIGAAKLWSVFHSIPKPRITNDPWFYISLAVMIIGTQFFLVGFLGEMLVKENRNLSNYRISEKIKIPLD